MSSSPFNPREQETNANFVVRAFPKRFSRATSGDQHTSEHEVEAPNGVIAAADSKQNSSEDPNNAMREEDVTYTESLPLTLIVRLSSKTIDMQPHTTAHITRLPAELLNKIFSALNRADSVCLGLASYKLYLVHRSFYRNGTDLWAPNRLSKNPLYGRLRAFMGQKYVYYESHMIFVTRKRFAELRERERRVDEEGSELSDDSLDWMSPRTFRRVNRFWFPDYSDDEDE